MVYKGKKCKKKRRNGTSARVGQNATKNEEVKEEEKKG